MSMIWSVRGISLNNLPLVDTQLNFYYGPDRSKIYDIPQPNGSGIFQGYADGLDPNETENWEASLDPPYVNPLGYTTSRIYSTPGIWPAAAIQGAQTSANVVLSPFRIPQLDRVWMAGSNASAAHGNAMIGSFTLQIRTIHRELYASQDEAGSRVPTGLIDGAPYYWGETASITNGTQGIITLSLCGLFYESGSLNIQILSQAGIGANMEAGVEAGMDLLGFCRAYMSARDAGAVGFCVLASNGSIPAFDPCRLDSVEGMIQLQKASMLGSWSYVQDANELWWPVGEVTYWDRVWQSLAPVSGWINWGTCPDLGTTVRAQAGLIPSMR